MYFKNFNRKYQNNKLNLCCSIVSLLFGILVLCGYIPLIIPDVYQLIGMTHFCIFHTLDFFSFVSCVTLIYGLFMNFDTIVPSFYFFIQGFFNVMYVQDEFLTSNTPLQFSV